MSYNQYNNSGYGQPPPQPGYGGGGGYGAPPPPQPPGAHNGYPSYGAQAPPPPMQQHQQHQQGGYAAQGGYATPPVGYGGQQTQPQTQQGYQQGYQQQPYGAPPPAHQAYGAAPPPPHQQQAYGAPTPQPYGAPPLQPYGAAAAYGVPSPQPYGALPLPPQQQQQQLLFLGTPIPPPPPAQPLTFLQGYEPGFDADRVRKATKGFGTDEKTLIDVLTPLDAFKVDLLARTYEGLVGKSLKETLEKELSGWLENGLVLTALGPLKGDLHLLHRACVGAGTHEDLLTELLIHRTNQEIWLLKQGYQHVYGKDLVNVVRGELSMKTERMFVMALAGTRDENPMVNQQLVTQDVEALYKAGAGQFGTDEIKICGILQQRSDPHLHAIAAGYQAKYHKKLSQAIETEFSGHMRDALLYLVRYFEDGGNGIQRDAAMLEDAMSGMGTKDERLVWRIVRGHWNRQRWEEVKRAYQQRYGKSLASRVKSETSGKYERMLVALIG